MKVILNKTKTKIKTKQYDYQKTKQNKMEKQIELGLYKVTLSEEGLVFTPRRDIIPREQWNTRLNATAGEVWLKPESVSKLKDWLDNSGSSELYGGKQIAKKEYKVDYKDKMYVEKRKILRQLSIKDEIRNCLDVVTDEIFDCIMYNFRNCAYKSIKDRIGIEMNDLHFWHYIRTFLVDGFLAFEIIFDGDKPIDLHPVDPSTLVPQYDPKTNNMFWIQNPDKESVKRILTNKQIIYLGYSGNATELHTSYVEELKESYERLKMAESSVFFPSVDPSMRPPIEAVRWLYEAFENISRIPKLRPVQYKVGECSESDVLRYNKFIGRIVKIFDTEFFDKINSLNK